MEPKLVDQVNEHLKKFEDRRIERLQAAREIMARYDNIDDLFVDMANIFMLVYIAKQMPKTPQGFVSDSAGRRMPE